MKRRFPRNRTIEPDRARSGSARAKCGKVRAGSTAPSDSTDRIDAVGVPLRNGIAFRVT